MAFRGPQVGKAELDGAERARPFERFPEGALQPVEGSLHLAGLVLLALPEGPREALVGLLSASLHVARELGRHLRPGLRQAPLRRRRGWRARPRLERRLDRGPEPLVTAGVELHPARAGRRSGQLATSEDDFLVQACAVPAYHDEAGEGDNEQAAANEAEVEILCQSGLDGGDTAQPGPAAPDGAPQEPCAVGDERVAEVGVDHVLTAFGDRGVEGEQAPLPRERVGQALQGPLPATSQFGHLVGAVAKIGQRRLAGQGEPGRDHPGHVGRGNVETAHALLELGPEAGHILPGAAGTQLPLGPERSGRG